MLLDVLGMANGPTVLGAMGRLDEPARFTDIRAASPGLGDSQVSRAIKGLNGLGLVAGRPQPDKSMRYSVTKAGAEVLALLQDVHKLVHKKTGAVAQETDRQLERILAP